MNAPRTDGAAPAPTPLDLDAMETKIRRITRTYGDATEPLILDMGSLIDEVRRLRAPQESPRPTTGAGSQEDSDSALIERLGNLLLEPPDPGADGLAKGIEEMVAYGDREHREAERLRDILDSGQEAEIEAAAGTLATTIAFAGPMNCREEEGGFIIEIGDWPIFTCSRGSHSLDMAPGLTLPQIKSALFALGAELLRVDERPRGEQTKTDPAASLERQKNIAAHALGIRSSDITHIDAQSVTWKTRPEEAPSPAPRPESAKQVLSDIMEWARLFSAQKLAMEPDHLMAWLEKLETAISDPQSKPHGKLNREAKA